MIDQTLISGVMGSILTSIVMALIYIARTRNDTRNQVERDLTTTRNEVERVDADARHRVDTSRADSLETLVNALKVFVENNGKRDEQFSMFIQQMLMAIKENSGLTTGMMAAIVDGTKTGQTTNTLVEKYGSQTALTLDEFGSRIQHIPQMKEDVGAIKASTAALSSLETNLGESFSEQFIPVVNALRAVEQAVQALTKELGGRDKTIFEGLRNLEGLFREAKLEFMRRISPDVAEHIPELLPKDPPDAPNGNTANLQNLPIDIHIKSAAPKETP